MAQWFKQQVDESEDFEVLAPVPLNTICFRKVVDSKSLHELNQINEDLMHSLNKSGKIFLTHVKLNGIFTLRMVIGQTEVEQRHVEKAWNLIKSMSRV
jgi:aromatic-L-amino-acid decarboxylase